MYGQVIWVSYLNVGGVNGEVNGGRISVGGTLHVRSGHFGLLWGKN